MRYKGLSVHLEVLCLRGMSLPAYDNLLSDMDSCSRYDLHISGGLRKVRDLWVKTTSCRYRLWCKRKNFNLSNDVDTESLFFLPVIDRTAKFWATCIF